MKRTGIALVLAGLCSLHGEHGWTASTATQTIHFQIKPVNELVVSGQPATIVVVTAEDTLGEATDASTTYAVTTNEASRKITGSLSGDLPPGVSLKISLGAPEGGASVGEVELSGTAADLVTGITRRTSKAKPIIYRVQAKKGSGTVPVVLTLTS